MSSVRIGMRIEFRDSEEYAGAVYCEDKYLAVAVPRPGEKIALASLTGVTVPKLPLELFLPVYSVEHYPCEVDAASGPGCIAVIRHAALSRPADRQAIARGFAERGWTVSGLDGS